MCRSWAMVHAYGSGADFILSLDDDTEPVGDVFDAYERVFDRGAVCSPYFDVGALTSFPGQSLNQGTASAVDPEDDDAARFGRRSTVDENEPVRHELRCTAEALTKRYAAAPDPAHPAA